MIKNPKCCSAGKLLEETGLKGHKIGNMEFSKVHANFLVNLGNGRFEDAIQLIKIAEKKGPKKSLVILGLAAWNTGQLDGEIEFERWTLSEIDDGLIFDMENKKKWLKAINNSFIRL